MTNTASPIYSTTQAELRPIISKLVNGRDGFFSGTSTSAGNAGGTTFIDTNRQEPSDYFNGFHSFLTVGTASGSGRIQDFASGASPTFTLASAFGAPTQIASASAYELHRYFSVSDINEAIKMAIFDINRLSLIPIEYENESAPSTTLTAAASAAAGVLDDANYQYKITFLTQVGETTPSSASTAVDANAKQMSLTAIPLGSANVHARKIYRTEGGGSTYKLLTTLNNNTATTYTDNIADASLGAEAPSTDSTQLTLSSSSSEYPIPNGFSHIYAIEIEADTDDWYPISPGGWAINRANRKAIIDLNVVNSYPGRNFRYLGLSPHATSLTDASSIYIDPNFLIYKAAAMLCLEKSSGLESNSGWLQKASYYETKAEAIKQGMRAAIPNNTKKVGY